MKYLLSILTLIASIQAQVLVDQYRFTEAGVTPGNNLLTDLAVAWTFDETSGNPQDHSGNGRHLTHFGTVESASGIISNSRFHDSVENDDYFGINNDTWNTFGSNNFTIAYWFKPDATAGSPQDQVHIAKADSDFSWLIEIDNGIGYTFDNAMVFYASTNGVNPAPTATLEVEFPELIAGNSIWYSVVVRRDGNTFTMYLGKQSVGAFIGADTATQSGELFDNSTVPLTVGVYLAGGAVVPTHDTQGEIDEMFIWSRALSDCEIAKWFNAGFGKSYAAFDSNPCL